MIFRVSLILVIIGITYLSLTPKYTISMGNDKLGHFIAYGVLMLNIGLLTVESRKKIAIGALLSILYGIIMEVGQYFVPGRSFSLLDVVANMGGTFLGVILILIFSNQITELLKRTGINR